MPILLSQDLVPEELLGYQSTAVITIDDEQNVSSCNWAATRLLGIDPVVSIQLSFPEAISEPLAADWIRSAEIGSNFFVDRPARPLDVRCIKCAPNLKVVAITDATTRLSLVSSSDSYEKSQLCAFANWKAGIQSLALLGLLREYAEDPQSSKGLLELARRTGKVLFPSGGALSLVGSDCHYTVEESWGEPFSLPRFAESTCGTPDETSTLRCRHFHRGTSGFCFKFHRGLLSLVEPEHAKFNTEMATLFAQTIDAGMFNLVELREP